jgi:hypothetical protein
MTTKTFTMTMTEQADGRTSLSVTNEHFSEFELIGLLVHVIDKCKIKINEKEEPLEKEMD